MTDKVDWRDKYRALALEAEQYEQQHIRMLECLRSLAVQFDLAVHGQYPRLDQLLSRLESKLQSGQVDAVPELLRKAEKYVRMLDENRMHRARQLITRLDEWAQLLLQQSSGDQSGTLLDVRHRLAENGDEIQALPELMDKLLECQRRHREPEAGDADEGAGHEEVISRRLSSRLLELVRQFQVPDSYDSRVQALIERLESAPDADVLEECIEQVMQLAQLCGRRLEADIQEYLEGLNEQLVYLRSFLGQAEVSESRQRQRSDQLDQVVRRDVQNISQTVRQADDIGELKSAVSTQLVRLIKAVNAHKEAENRHISELRRERQRLQQRLDRMESLAEDFRKSAEEAHMKSRTDPLTGLANRSAYTQQLGMELERFRRYGTPFSICIADIDYFKRVNDDYGHLAGDKVLRLLANILRGKVRGVDFIARFGGEEFVILMPSTRGEEARQVAEKLRLAVEQSPFNFQSKPVRITISIGVAEVTAEDTADTLFSRADTSLYSAKSGGRNRVVLSG